TTHACLASSACVTTLQRQKVSSGPLADIHSASRLLIPHILACHDWIEHLRDYEPVQRGPGRVGCSVAGDVCVMDRWSAEAPGYAAVKRGPRRVGFSVVGEFCVTHGLSTEATGFLELALKRGERDGETLDGGQRSEAMLALATLYKGSDDDKCDQLLRDIELS